MGTSIRLRFAVLCATLAAACPAFAQMYKWVDDGGQVTYSNTPPPDAAQKKVEAVPERVSVYTPDPLINKAMAEGARRETQPGRQLEAERTAYRPTNAELAARSAAAYERCVAERRVDCDAIRSGYGGDMVYGYTGVYGPQFVVGARNFPPGAPFFVDPTPPPRVGVSTAPPVGIDNRPPVGAPPRSRAVGAFR